MAATRSLSVVVPVFDEEENARPLVERTVEAVRPMGLPFELIVVDDGSRDRTLEVLRSVVPTVPELVVVALRRNFGQTAALQAGFDRARGDVVVTLDGDLQNDPRDIPLLLQRLEAGADVVSGWRRRRHDALVLRKVPSWIANRLIRRLTGVPVHDQGCALKAYRRAVVDSLSLYSDMHRYVAALALGTAASIAEVEVRHHPRQAGQSKYGLSRVFKVLADVFVVQMITRAKERPTLWFTLLGTPFLLGAGLFGAVAAWRWGASLVLPSVAILLSFVFTFCVLAGLVGEMIVDSAPGSPSRRVVFRELGEER